jgi:hypothetical protein
MFQRNVLPPVIQAGNQQETCRQCSSETSGCQSHWRFTANQFVLATSPLRITPSKFIFQLNTCGYSLCVTSSPLLLLASAVILGWESRGTHGHILQSQIRHSSNLKGQVPVFILLGTGFPFHRLLTSGCRRTIRRYNPEDCTIARASKSTKIPYIY